MVVPADARRRVRAGRWRRRGRVWRADARPAAAGGDPTRWQPVPTANATGVTAAHARHAAATATAS